MPDDKTDHLVHDFHPNDGQVYERLLTYWPTDSQFHIRYAAGSNNWDLRKHDYDKTLTQSLLLFRVTSVPDIQALRLLLCLGLNAKKVIITAVYSWEYDLDAHITILGCAVDRGWYPGAALILANGADPDFPYERAKIVGLHYDGNTNRPEGLATCLQAAVHNRDYSMTRLLLSHGANASRRFNGTTALHIAAASNTIISVEILCEHGASTKSRDWRERTPLELAIEMKSHDAADTIREYA